MEVSVHDTDDSDFRPYSEQSDIETDASEGSDTQPDVVQPPLAHAISSDSDSVSRLCLSVAEGDHVLRGGRARVRGGRGRAQIPQAPAPPPHQLKYHYQPLLGLLQGQLNQGEDVVVREAED
jgi:hypothetical protein